MEAKYDTVHVFIATKGNRFFWSTSRFTGHAVEVNVKVELVESCALKQWLPLVLFGR
jgi:hypothetical protein